jgi:hypothetical protein
MSQIRSKALAPEFQKEIISLIVSSNNFSNGFFSLIKGVSNNEMIKNLRIFSDPTIHEIYKQFSECKKEKDYHPSRGEFIQFIHDNFHNENRDTLVQRINSLYEMKVESTKEHEQTVLNLVIMAKVLNHLNHIPDLTESKNAQEDILKISDDIVSFAEDIKNTSFTKANVIDVTDPFSLIKEYAVTAGQKIQLGHPDLDDALNGGIGRQEVTVLISRVNGGKSILLVNICANALRQYPDENIAFVVMEGKKLQTPIRLMSNLTDIPYEILSNAKKTIDESSSKSDLARYFKQYYGFFKSRFSLEKFFEAHDPKDFNNDESFSNWCMDKLDKYEKEFGHRISMIDCTQDSSLESILLSIEQESKRLGGFSITSIDYGQLIKVANLKFATTDLELKHIFRELEKLSSRIYTSCIVPMQAKTEAMRKLEDQIEKGTRFPYYDIASCADSKKPADSSATVLAWTRTNEENKMGRGRVTVVKSRESRTDFQIGFIPRWDICKIMTDDIYFKGFGDENQLQQYKNDQEATSDFFASKKDNVTPSTQEDDSPKEIIASEFIEASNILSELFSQWDYEKTTEIRDQLIHLLQKEEETIKERVKLKSLDVSDENFDLCEEKIELNMQEISNIREELPDITYKLGSNDEKNGPLELTLSSNGLFKIAYKKAKKALEFISEQTTEKEILELFCEINEIVLKIEALDD